MPSSSMSSGALAGAGPTQTLPLRSPMAFALLVQMLIWTLGPTLLIGNLHGDTLEAAYWGREWALGYSKHPPVTTWAIDLVLRSGFPPILGLMLLSQITVAIATWYIWRAVRLFASPETASLAALMYLASPAATFYAVQINHNSMLSPFLAATAFYGLRYLEDLRWRDAIALGVAAGFGLWTKYEIFFLLAALVSLAVAVARYRPAFARPSSYASVLVFAAIAAPHVWWLSQHDWTSVFHAVDANKVKNVSDLQASSQNLIVGVFALCVAPALMLLATNGLRGRDEFSRVPERPWVAVAMGFGPPFVLLLGAILTYKIIKPLWLQPFCVTTAAGLALLFPAGGQGEGLSERATARISIVMSAIILVGFAIYLVIAGAIGKPLWAFSADTRPLAEATQAFWDKHGKGPLRCVVISDRKIGPSGVLWLKSRPDYLDFSTPNWSHPEQIAACRAVGGVAALAEKSPALDNFAPACLGARETFNVRMMPGQGGPPAPVELVYIAPEPTAGACEASR